MSARATRILIADDDPAFRAAMGKALSRFGYSIEDAASGEEAVRALRSGRADVALLDLQLGDMDGLAVLDRARGTRTRVVVVTGHGTIPAAVEAMRLGAVSFVQKPVDAPSLLPLIEDAAGEVAGPAAPAASGDDLGLAGASAALAKVRDLVRRAGPTGETVLVTGESGVGKELVARALHAQSPRSGGPFVAFNCAVAHGELFAAELFGHVKGAFTGATQDHRGLLREAAGGTLLLDEVGELPEEAQAKLLRVLETGLVRPVGGSREEPVDVRVLAATNRDLAQEARDGRFRQDLFFRLNVLCIHMPPLRERREDIDPIARALLDRLCATRGRQVVLEPEAVGELAAYDWPGNVRELQSVLKRALVFARTDRLGAGELRDAIGSSIFGLPEARAASRSAAGAGLTLAEAERSHILATFERLGGNVTRTALALGVDRRTLQRKLRSFGRDVGED